MGNLTAEDKTLFGLILTIGLGFYMLSKVNKKKGFSNETDELIQQDCYNSGKEAKIPDEKLGEFVADCVASVKSEEA